jgi:hypothetical protein
MKELLLTLLTIIMISSCITKEYKYEIHGKVYIPTAGVHPMHDAIWYTDTISFDGDTLYYFNSDGSKVTIRPPYVLIDNTKEYESKIRDNKK